MLKPTPSKLLAVSAISLALFVSAANAATVTEPAANSAEFNQLGDRRTVIAQQTHNTQSEEIHFELEPGWIIGSSKEQPNLYSITEFIREGDSLKNWHELVTIQDFNLKSGIGSPEAMFNHLKVLREEECPGSTIWNEIQKDEKSILYEWQAKPCLGFPEQHEIARMVDGKFNRFLIRYTAKVYQLEPKRREQWIERFSHAALISREAPSEGVKFTWLEEHLQTSKESDNQIREAIFQDDLKTAPDCQIREVVKIARDVPLLSEEGKDYRWLHYLEKWDIKRCNQLVPYIAWQTFDQVHAHQRLIVVPLDKAQALVEQQPEKQPALKKLLQYKP